MKQAAAVITVLEGNVSMLSGGIAEVLGGERLQVLTDALACCGGVNHVVNVACR